MLYIRVCGMLSFSRSFFSPSLSCLSAVLSFHSFSLSRSRTRTNYTPAARDDAANFVLPNLLLTQFTTTVLPNSLHTHEAVREANLRRAPGQNGNARRTYLSFAHAEAASELALRPPDRQVCNPREKKTFCYILYLALLIFMTDI